MRRLYLVFVLLTLAGCQNIIGPFQHRDAQRVDDPLVSIDEQHRRGRDRLALPDESATVAPPVLDIPGAHSGH